MLCSIDLSAPRELDFTLQVFGSSTTNQVEARFMIVGSDFAVVCHCVQIEGGIKVYIPRLDGVLPAGVHRARFEVILGDKIFVPIEDEIELTSPVKITASMAAAPDAAKPTVTMKMAAPVAEPAAVTYESLKPLFAFKPTEKPEAKEEPAVIEEAPAQPAVPAKKQPRQEDLDAVTAMLRKSKK